MSKLRTFIIMKSNRSYKIMVVDDEADICFFMKQFFEKRNFEVSFALNGLEALPIVEREKPHVILLDIKMPGMSGLDILPYIKNISPKTKVIIVSKFDDPEKMNSAKNNGADGYFTKPVVLDDLLDRVNSICAKRI